MGRGAEAAAAPSSAAAWRGCSSASSSNQGAAGCRVRDARASGDGGAAGFEKRESVNPHVCALRCGGGDCDSQGLERLERRRGSGMGCEVDRE